MTQEDEESMKAAQIVDLKKRWREQQDDVLFPDEVIAPSSSACWQPRLLRSVLCLSAPRCTTMDCQVKTEDRNASSRTAL